MQYNLFINSTDECGVILTVLDLHASSIWPHINMHVVVWVWQKQFVRKYKLIEANNDVDLIWRGKKRFVDLIRENKRENKIVLKVSIFRSIFFLTSENARSFLFEEKYTPKYKMRGQNAGVCVHWGDSLWCQCQVCFEIKCSTVFIHSKQFVRICWYQHVNSRYNFVSWF